MQQQQPLHQKKRKIKDAGIWDCASPNYGHSLCESNHRSEDEESTAYSPRTGAHFYYPTPQVIDQPPIAFVIPPTIQAYRTSRSASRNENRGSFTTDVARTRSISASRKEKRGTFATDITVATQQDHISDELSDEGSGQSFCSGRRRFWLLITSLIVLIGGIFSIGLGIGIGVRGENKKSAGSNAGSGVTKKRNATDILVGAYYYPWHGNNFHNGDGYVRSQLEPPQYPTLGEYDDTKPETISQHLKWSRQANIGLWVTSWWGPNRLEDTTTKDVILTHEELGDMKIAIHYETTNRVRDGNMENVESDIKYMCNNYFNHKNYYKIDGRPVIFIYVSRVLERQGYLEQTILLMRSTASRCGKNIFIVGDYVFSEAPKLEEDDTRIQAFLYFDAVTNYDMYGSMGKKEYHAGSTVLTQYYSDQKAWKDLAAAQGCRYMPTVSPGYNDRGVRLQVDHQPLSRRLTADSVEGSLFAMAVEHARRLVDPTIDNLLLVNSFNEWHEDTQIEPCEGQRTNSPDILTLGVEYEGYGELYLDILREGTRPQGKSDEDNIFKEGGT
jgi:glycoprotein endo-alpha-1,2-mannosidase